MKPVAKTLLLIFVNFQLCRNSGFGPAMLAIAIVFCEKCHANVDQIIQNRAFK